MKQLDLKDTEVPKAGNEKNSYADLIRIVMSQQPQGGFPIEEIRNRLKVLDDLDKAENGVLLLEDARADKLIECVKVMRWPFMHQGILDFTDDVVLKMREVDNGSAKDGD